MATIGNAPVFPTESVLPGNLQVTGNATVSGNATISGTTNSVGALTENGNAALVVDKTSQPLDISSSATNGSIKLDSSSRTFAPNQPSFKAYKNAGQINSNNTLLVFDNTSYAGGHNVGGHYNTTNGRFTAPIDGYYLFAAAMLTNNAFSGNTFVSIFWQINGSNVHYFAHNHTSAWIMEGSAVVFYLTTNDYVNLYQLLGSGHYGSYSYFSGRLLG